MVNGATMYNCSIEDCVRESERVEHGEIVGTHNDLFTAQWGNIDDDGGSSGPHQSTNNTERRND